MDNKLENLNRKIEEFNFNNFSKQERFNLFSNVKELPIISHIIQKGRPIFRCRKHVKFNNMFYFERDISYRTDLQNIILYGRANLPFNSKFYGSIPTDELADGASISIFETSPNLRNNGDGIEFFTVGKWKAKEKFEVATIVPDPLKQKLSNLNDYLINIFNEHKSKNRFTNDQSKFHELIGREFSKVVLTNFENEYAISSTFAEAILQNSKVGGIIFPAVNAYYKGINIVLNPMNADKFLQLEAVMFGILFKFGQFSTFKSILSADLKDGYPFKWKKDKEAETSKHTEIFELLKLNNIPEDEIFEKLIDQIKRM